MRLFTPSSHRTTFCGNTSYSCLYKSIVRVTSYWDFIASSAKFILRSLRAINSALSYCSCVIRQNLVFVVEILLQTTCRKICHLSTIEKSFHIYSPLFLRRSAPCRGYRKRDNSLHSFVHAIPLRLISRVLGSPFGKSPPPIRCRYVEAPYSFEPDSPPPN